MDLTRNPKKCKCQFLPGAGQQDVERCPALSFFTKSSSGRHAAYSKLPRVLTGMSLPVFTQDRVRCIRVLLANRPSVNPTRPINP